jgi:hypothetical protein
LQQRIRTQRQMLPDMVYCSATKCRFSGREIAMHILCRVWIYYVIVT